MLERVITVPAAPDRLWEALTAPEQVADWFGARVEWDLRPGGRARFDGDDGSVRDGRVDDVAPGRRLAFRWWPEGADGEASEVTYRLEPVEGGTRLTVTERPSSGATASARATATATASAGAWTAWDSRLACVWGRVAMPVAVAAR